MAANTDDGELDPDSFSSPASNREESNADNINPDPGEDHIGHITGANFSAGDFGVLEIDGRTFWLNGSTAQDLVAALLEDVPVRVVVDDEEQSFIPEDSDEEVVYHEKELQFIEDDG